MRAWVGAPPVLRAGTRMWVCVVCVVPVQCLCAGGCVAVRCVPWCRGAWCCLPSSASLVAPSLVLGRGVVLVVCLACPSHRVRPSLGCWLPSFFLCCCGALYALIYSPLARASPPCAFFPASALLFVSVFQLAYLLGPGVLFFLSCLVL